MWVQVPLRVPFLIQVLQVVLQHAGLAVSCPCQQMPHAATSFSAFGLHHWLVASTSWMLRGTGGWDKPLNNHEVLATEREPEGQPRRARGDDEASVARSAARGAYRHHHSTQHCAKRAAIYAIMCNDYLHRLHRGCNCTKLHPLLSGQNSIEAVIAPFNFKLSTTLLSTGES